MWYIILYVKLPKNYETDKRNIFSHANRLMFLVTCSHIEALLKDHAPYDNSSFMIFSGHCRSSSHSDLHQLPSLAVWVLSYSLHILSMTQTIWLNASLTTSTSGPPLFSIWTFWTCSFPSWTFWGACSPTGRVWIFIRFSLSRLIFAIES